MRLDRKKNTIRNTIWGIASRVVSILGPFAIRTIIIYSLGEQYLGLSSLFTSILQVLSLAELGFSSAVAYSMYKPIAENDDKTICQLLNFYKKVYRIVGSIIVLVGVIVLPFLDKFITGDAPNDINIYLLFIMYLFNSSISYFMFAYKSVLLSSYQREDIVSKIQSFLLLIQYVVQVVLLLVWKNYYIYYMVVPVMSISNNIIINYITKKIYPTLEACGEVSKEIVADLKQKVKGVLVSKFCGLTRNAFDNIIISAFLGLSAVAVYGNYYYITSNVASILVIMVTSMRAGIGNSIALESVEKNYNDYNKFSFIYMWISSWCAICILCLIQPFMELWMGKDNLFEFPVVVLLCIYFLWQTMGDITNAYSGGVGLWWENRIRTIVESISNLILNIILGYFLGVFGIVLATVITIFVSSFVWQTVILFKNYFKEYDVKIYFLNYLKYNLVTFFAAGITYYVCSVIDTDLFVEIILKGIICIIIPNIIFVLLYRKNKYMKSSVEFVKRIVKKG